jgi:hypothetical protein
VKPLIGLEKTHSAVFAAERPHSGRNVSRKKDRRKSRRIKDPILIFLYKDRWGNKAARPLDLSLEGIGIETSRPLKIDDNLQLAIIIGECQVNAQGRVIYTRKEMSGRFRSGIRFQEISERNREIINLYLEKTQRSRESEKNEQKFSDGSKKTQAT